MFRFVKNLFQPTTTRHTVRRPCSPRLHVEAMEDRCTPGGGLWTDGQSTMTLATTTGTIWGDVMIGGTPSGGTATAGRNWAG